MSEYQPQPPLEALEMDAAPERRFFDRNRSRAAALLMSGALLVGACSSDSGSNEVVSAPTVTEAPTTTQAPTTTTTMPEEEPWFDASSQRFKTTDGWVLEVDFELEEPSISSQTVSPGRADLEVTIPGHIEIRNAATRGNYTIPESSPFLLELYYADEKCEGPDRQDQGWNYTGLKSYGGEVDGKKVCANNTYILAPEGAYYPPLAPGERWESDVTAYIVEPIEGIPEARKAEYEELLSQPPTFIAIAGKPLSTVNFKSVNCRPYLNVIQLYKPEGSTVPFDDYVDWNGNCSLR